MTEELIPKEIHETPVAIRATIQNTRLAARKAAKKMRFFKPRRIFFIGNGTSYYSSIAAAYLGRELAKPDDPLVVAMPSGDFRYFRPSLNNRDVVIGVTASGEFRDVLAVFEELKGKCLCIGITHVPDSSVTKLADMILVSHGGQSSVPVMTKTYATTLTAAYLLILEFFNASQEVYSELSEAADKCELALSEVQDQLADIVSGLGEFDSGYYFGNGSGYASAMEAALKMKEMALFHAEGCESWEMASGPATMVNKSTVCFALYTGDRTDAAVAKLAGNVKDWGALVVEVGPVAQVGDLFLKITPQVRSVFAPLVLVPTLALLAYRFARNRDIDPNRPNWRERYLAQGMTHIMGE